MTKYELDHMVESCIGPENIQEHNRLLHDLLDLPFAEEADCPSRHYLQSFSSPIQRAAAVASHVLAARMNTETTSAPFQAVWHQYLEQSNTCPLDLPSRLLLPQDKERARLWKAASADAGPASPRYGAALPPLPGAQNVPKSRSLPQASILPDAEDIRSRMSQYCQRYALSSQASRPLASIITMDEGVPSVIEGALESHIRSFIKDYLLLNNRDLVSLISNIDH